MATSKQAKKAANDDPQARTRWGGILLALGAALGIVSLALYLSLPAMTGIDGPARAAQLAANADQVRMVGYVGMFGSAFTAVGAFFLVTRPAPNRWNIPTAFWLAVGVGSLMGMASNLFFGTGYLALAQTYAANPGVFSAALLATSATAGLGLLLSGTGFALVFLAEATSEHRAIPAALGYVAVLGALGSILGGFAFVTGLTALLPATALSFLLSISAIYFGIRVAWPSRLAAKAESSAIAEA